MAKKKIYNPTYTRTNVKVSMQNVLSKTNLSLSKYYREFINKVLTECEDNSKKKTAK